MLRLFGKNKNTAGVTVIGIESDGVCVVRVRHRKEQKPLLECCEFHACSDRGKIKDVLTQIRRAHGLGKVPCATVMEDKDYKLLMTEAPDVPDAELQSALRWHIKDMIDTPVNETTIDVFNVPGANVAGSGRSVYVVAADNKALQDRVDLLTAAGIKLGIIDIADMAQRNITSITPEGQKGVAILWLRPQAGLITLSKQGDLYLSRRLTEGLEQMKDEARQALMFDQVVLEIQRSLDYYESQLRQPAIASVLLAPLVSNLPGLLEYLQENLSVQVHLLDLEQLLHIEEKQKKRMPEMWQSKCYITIGAALRQETQRAADALPQ